MLGVVIQLAGNYFDRVTTEGPTMAPIFGGRQRAYAQLI